MMSISEEKLTEMTDEIARQREGNSFLRLDRDDHKAEIARLRGVIEDIFQQIANCRKGSMGGIDDTYVGFTIGVKRLEEWKRKALDRPIE